MPPPTLLLLPLTSLLLVSAASAAFDFGLWQPAGGGRREPGGPPGGFDYAAASAAPNWQAATFASVVQSSKSDSKRSRTEETKQEVLTHSRSSEWTRGFQDNGQGGLKRLDSASSEEKTAGRSAKELKASESGESGQRDQKQTWVNGKAVASADTGKQSSFSNSGHLANRTEFSSESSSSDNRLVKAALPPPPPPPPPALAACFSGGDRARPSLVFLVHASARPGSLARLLGFLETFLTRLAPPRAVLVFFNRRVLDVVHYSPAQVSDEDLRRRLADTARGLRDGGVLADECDLPAAAGAAVRLRHELRLAAPRSLVVLAAGGSGLLADDRALSEARPAAEAARRNFDQLTAAVVGEHGGGGRELEPRAADMLGLFSPAGLMPLEFGGGELADARSADALGRRVCEAAEAAEFRGFEEPWRRPHGGG